MDTKLLTLNQLAEQTGLPTAWLKREADAGRLPCIRAGRLRMFDLAAVLALLAGGYAPGDDDAGYVLGERLGVADGLGLPTHPGAAAWLVAVGENTNRENTP